ncbi:MAG: hypothetical protein WBF33_24320 [Candidatus Nitrosopolaris sp.]|jgi:hypothetical protein
MKTTIIINSGTRDVLKRIGTKGQTYDQIIGVVSVKDKQQGQGELEWLWPRAMCDLL